MALELTRSEESDGPIFPITAICIVSDKNKCPRGFQPIVKTNDDNSDADLWRESSFSIFSRPVRYLAFTRELPETTVKGSPISIVTDITVIKESDPVPHGYVPIDYTADSREKALRKRYLCIKTEPRDAVVDAVGEICIMGKTKKTPKGYTSAGEIDGALVVFKVVVIPPTFGLRHSASAQSLPTRAAPAPPAGLYPSLNPASTSNLASIDKVNAFTIKSPLQTKPKGVDGVPFKVHPSVNQQNSEQKDNLPQINFDIRRLDSDAFYYTFALEQATLAHPN